MSHFTEKQITEFARNTDFELLTARIFECADGTDYEQGQLEDMEETLKKTRKLCAALISVLVLSEKLSRKDLVKVLLEVQQL